MHLLDKPWRIFELRLSKYIGSVEIQAAWHKKFRTIYFWTVLHCAIDYGLLININGVLNNAGFEVEDDLIERAADVFEIDIQTDLDYLPQDVRHLFNNILPEDTFEEEDDIFQPYVQLMDGLANLTSCDVQFPKV